MSILSVILVSLILLPRPILLRLALRETVVWSLAFDQHILLPCQPCQCTVETYPHNTGPKSKRRVIQFYLNLRTSLPQNHISKYCKLDLIIRSFSLFLQFCVICCNGLFVNRQTLLMRMNQCQKWAKHNLQMNIDKHRNKLQISITYN